MLPVKARYETGRWTLSDFERTEHHCNHRRNAYCQGKQKNKKKGKMKKRGKKKKGKKKKEKDDGMKKMFLKTQFKCTAGAA